MLSLEKLKNVDTPARYTGGEAKQCIKNVAVIKHRVCLASPSIYEMASFDMEIKEMYYILNSRKDVWAERCFAPLLDFENLLKEEKEKLYTLESKTPLKDLDIVIFSVSSEMMYTNMINMLELGGIPAYKEKREGKYPLVIATGSAVINPKPLEKFVDMFIIGETSLVINEIMDRFSKQKEKPKDNILDYMKDIPGVYVPGFSFKNVYMVRELDIDSELVPKSVVLPSIKTIIDKSLVTLSKGCSRDCISCTHKYMYGKPSFMSVDKALLKTKRIINSTGNTEVMLMSNCYGDYPGFPDIIYKIKDIDRPKVKDISFMEIKFDKDNLWLLKYINNFEEVPSIIVGATNKPLQDIIGVGMTEEDVCYVAKKLFEAGFSKVKLKYIIGIPSETFEDLTKILNMANKVCKVYKEVYAKSPETYIVELILYNFKPKPHTPSQWCPINSYENFEIKIKYLMDKNKESNVIISHEEGKQSVIETILARGDEKVSDIIYEAYLNGARNDMMEGMFSWDIWQIAINNVKIDVKQYLTMLNDKMYLPWDNICVGTPKEGLRRIYINRIKGE